ncbi:hypothetical protein RhiirA1_470492 [Rhizophagus irregularis]|uniref:Uncharacterized protein n=1 Tax=Rhizophagus irregularis TaxID=588596 RepID=A0A2N0QZU8_9GLOM|nr:hypothetical protein RhiirA1_473792 [Rhizophagus irregularis]PKC58760.1 hypothetical protein RhiirA1_470492 [Rhizophagus irregularis]
MKTENRFPVLDGTYWMILEVSDGTYQRFWNSEVPDRIYQRFWNSEVPNRTYQRFWNSEVLDRTYQKFWNSEVLDQMEPIDDFEIRRFQMEPINDFEIQRSWTPKNGSRLYFRRSALNFEDPRRQSKTSLLMLYQFDYWVLDCFILYIGLEFFGMLGPLGGIVSVGIFGRNGIGWKDLWRNGLRLPGCFLNGTSKVHDFLEPLDPQLLGWDLDRTSKGCGYFQLFGQLYDRILKVFGFLDKISKVLTPFERTLKVLAPFERTLKVLASFERTLKAQLPFERTSKVPSSHLAHFEDPGISCQTF